MAYSALKSSSMVRLFELYRKIPSYRGVGVTTKDLHQYLLDEGFKVTKRTVERDLLKLSEIAGIFAERTIEGNVWKNSASNLDLLPTMQPSEALLFVAAERYLRRSLPPSSEQMLNDRLCKAEKTLSKINRLGHWDKKLFIIDGQLPHTNHSYSTAISTSVYEAVLQEVQMSLEYLKLGCDSPQRYQLNPLAIIVREHDHYLVATKRGQSDTPQLFNFSRMISAVQTHEAIERPLKFNLKEYIDSNPSGWLISKEVQQIQIKVKGFAHYWLTHNQLDSSQQLIRVDDEWFMLTLNAHVTYDLIGWILRFSTDVVAIHPQLLVDEITDRLEQLTSLYANSKVTLRGDQ